MAEFDPSCGYVSVIGRPNVGKSTFINQLMQRKLVITSKRPQTTRNSVTCILTNPSWNMQLILLDTPGINFNQKDHVTTWMHQQALKALKQADVCLWLIEDCQWKEYDERIAQLLHGRQETTVVLINKIDKVKDKTKIFEQMQRLASLGFHRIIPMSALKDKGFEALFKVTKELLPKQEFLYSPEQQVTVTKEFMVVEIVREKMMRYLGEEVPYEVSIQLESMETTENNLLKVALTVFALNDRHKKIIIGAQGQQLKKIGQAARLTLEQVFKQKVYLNLWVKVKDSNAASLDSSSQFGLGDE